MYRQELNRNWVMEDGDRKYSCDVPCSVYHTLMQAGEMEDPYWGENEWNATGICERDFSFEKTFAPEPELLTADRVFLVMEGVDTLGEIRLNGRLLGRTDNMHRRWEYEVGQGLREENNILRAELKSPNRYVREKVTARPLWGVDGTMPGYPYLRKAHYMFGWDWGPVLPDLGLWRGVSLRGYVGGRILDVYYQQEHSDGAVTLTAWVRTETWGEGITCRLRVTSPDGQTWETQVEDGRAKVVITDPKLWWVRGLGDQPLYACRVEMCREDQVLDVCERRIGLRTLTVSQEEDQWGKEFCFINNGIRVFAMGANYIPEDQILPRCSRERTEKLLEDCYRANYNFIRVWGGGCYPGEDFYDWCDEHGLIIWQDFMFACSAYLLEPEFEETVRAEIRDNILRLRNHASLGLWCGNNEIESAWEGWGLPEDPQARADYLKLFEGIIPDILRQEDPETFYWPSSPSSGGGIHDASSNRAGDMHYWAVWHNFKPIEAFREFYYRFCSEYGFESLPDLRTIRAFAEEKDLDLCGNVMQAHQKCVQGNEKVMYYLAQMVNYPTDFRRLIYCSQLVQADCIRSNVEHMRRARGRCMGSAYWQVNDSNPVISWSSIDYFGRWKGLHYAAKKFYAPVLLSCDDTCPAHPALHVTNDSLETGKARVVCHLRDRQAQILKTWETEVVLSPLSTQKALEMDLEGLADTRETQRTRYLEYVLLRDGETLSGGTTLFVRPKAFEFLPVQVKWEVLEQEDRFEVLLTADGFAKSVCLSLKEVDCVFSDNWFDIHGEEPVRITVRKADLSEPLSLARFQRQLTVEHYGEGTIQSSNLSS